MTQRTQEKPYTITRKTDILEEYKARAEKAELLFENWRNAGLLTPKPPETISAAIKQGKTIALGEYHMHSSPRQFLIEHMKDLAEAGYPLVLEHMFTQQQSLLDAWLTSDKDLSAFPELQRMADFFDGAFDKQSREAGGKGTENCGFKDLLLSAKAHKVKILAFEDELSMLAAQFTDYPLEGLSDPGSYSRIALMNLNVYESIEKAALHPNPFIVFVGASHLINN